MVDASHSLGSKGYVSQRVSLTVCQVSKIRKFPASTLLWLHIDTPSYISYGHGEYTVIN